MLYKRKAALTLIELVFVISLISTLMGSFAFSVINAIMAAKEAAFQNELSNWRHAVELYRALNGSYPQDLRELIGKEYTYGVVQRSLNIARYIAVYRLDKEGFPLDPFGRRYIYNSYTGEVIINRKH